MRFLQIREEVEADIRLEKLESLLPHEKTKPEVVNQLSHEIETDAIQKDPIIVEKENDIVLDGMHRVAALKKLGYDTILCYYVSYKDPRIRVGRWYRLLSSNQTIPLIKMIESIQELDKFNIEYIEDPQEVERLVDESKTVTVLITADKSVLIKSRYATKDVVEVYNHHTLIEEQLTKHFGIRTIYDTKAKIERKDVLGVLVLPKIDKKDVIVATKSGVLFPHKSTRHILKIRPLFINYPINFLRGDDIHEKNEKIRAFLQQKEIRYIPGGMKTRGRTYEEDIVIYDPSRNFAIAYTINTPGE